MKFSNGFSLSLLAIALSACSQPEAPTAPVSPKKTPVTAERAGQPAPLPSVAAQPPPPGVTAPAAASPAPTAPEAEIKDDPGSMSKADALNLVVNDFKVQFGRPPQNLEELISKKLIARLPAAPEGMKFVYDPKAEQVKVVKK